MIQAVVLLAGAIAGVSLVVSGVLALAVVIWAQDTPSALRIIGNGYYALVGLMPIALWLTIYVTRDDEEYEAAYGSALRAIITVLQGAAIGSTLGAGPIFLTVVINLPVILSDFAIGEFGPAVRDAVLWSRLLLAVGAAVISAIPLGLWAYYTGVGREDD
ncbi:MAG: hypothetical protein IT328_17715 [Caldilineaceae bacterium]|nr:hypothetical protein [Caldilineaceae bacterium]